MVKTCLVTHDEALTYLAQKSNQKLKDVRMYPKKFQRILTDLIRISGNRVVGVAMRRVGSTGPSELGC